MAAAVLVPQIVPLWDIAYTQAITTAAGVIPMAALLLWVISLGTVVPFASETAAMRWIPATTVSVLAMLEPIGAAAIGWWWFDERLTAFQIFGAVLVLAGITMALLSRADDHPSVAVPE